ncbi:MAG: hypothetical protein U0269_10395 [Polyangiales bacterium]
MRSARDDDKRVRPERAHAQRGVRRALPRADERKVHRALDELLDRASAIALHVERDARRALAARREQRRQLRKLEVVEARDAKRSLRARGIKRRLSLQRAPHVRERRGQLFGQRSGARSQRKRAPVLHEELVAELLAQRRERVAHRRLRDARAPGRVRHVARLEQQRERRKQVQVERRDIEITHTFYENNDSLLMRVWASRSCP